jgi:hypothetical protein
MNVVFYRPSLGSVSPLVSVAWDKPVVELLNLIVPMGTTVNFGSYAEEACADFIVALAAHPVTAELNPRVEVLNLRLRWDRIDPLCPERAADIPAWRNALLAEVERLDADIADPKERLVWVETDPPNSVTRGGRLLCRRVNVLSEPWEEGQPMWVAPPGAGKARRTRRGP